MLKYDLSTLDYMKLSREARKLDTARCERKIRLAVLADCAPQHIVTLLKVLLAKNGIAAEIYEAEYDTIELDVSNPESAFYAFDPQYVLILNSVFALRKKYVSFKEEPRNFAAVQMERMKAIWETISARSEAVLIQSNFAVPYERLFGSYEAKGPGSFYTAVQQLNRLLSEEAASNPRMFLWDVEYTASFVGKKNWFDEKMWILSKALCAYEFLPLTLQGAVDVVMSQLGSGVKCVVLDLDNTVWGGIIGDDGLEGIRLGHFEDGEAFEAFQHFMLELKKRGILLAVCSKNDEAVALRPFREHPDMVLKEDDITVFVANWQNKAENIRNIREILNIGFDSMVFLDDNPFERQVVREQIPGLIVPELPEDPALYLKAIAELNLFETASYSALDQDRSQMYREQAKRQLAEKSFSDPREYLKSLEMKITLARFDNMHLPRIVQLMQRSNQFNLMTQRFSQAQCESMMADEQGFFPFYVKLRDKFGDNGLISVVILKFAGQEMEIAEWLMSCRVLARGVEQYTMNFVVNLAKQRGIEKITGRYRPTAKNAMVKDFYGRFGFRKSDETPEECRWELTVNDYEPGETFMETEEMRAAA